LRCRLTNEGIVIAECLTTLWRTTSTAGPRSFFLRLGSAGISLDCSIACAGYSRCEAEWLPAPDVAQLDADLAIAFLAKVYAKLWLMHVLAGGKAGLHERTNSTFSSLGSPDE
jgi:hypothetical protein